jgi:hypothetical protein
MYYYYYCDYIEEIRVKIRDCGGLAVISDLLDLSVAQSDRSQSDSEEIPMYINRHGSNLDRSIHLEAIRLITNLSIDGNNQYYYYHHFQIQFLYLLLLSLL